MLYLKDIFYFRTMQNTDAGERGTMKAFLLCFTRGTREKGFNLNRTVDEY